MWLWPWANENNSSTVEQLSSAALGSGLWATALHLVFYQPTQLWTWFSTSSLSCLQFWRKSHLFKLRHVTWRRSWVGATLWKPLPSRARSCCCCRVRWSSCRRKTTGTTWLHWSNTNAQYYCSSSELFSLVVHHWRRSLFFKFSFFFLPLFFFFTVCVTHPSVPLHVGCFFSSSPSALWRPLWAMRRTLWNALF